MSVQTETLEIRGLGFETLRDLNEKAREAGKTVEDFARTLIEQAMAPRELTFVAPIRKQVEESGTTDDELDELDKLSMEARRDLHREQKEVAQRHNIPPEIADWTAKMDLLAREVDAASIGEKSALEELAEMRR
jgi:hypothetical protein